MKVLENFYYCDSGNLICKRYFTPRIRVGDAAGSTSRDCIRVQLNNISKPLSHWVFHFFNGRFPIKLIHIDGDVFNNKIENLIEVPQFEPLTKEWARFYFDYKDGFIYRKYKARSHPKGIVNGKPNSRGYLVTTIGKKIYSVHNIVWCYFNDKKTEKVVDHINGNKLDNRIENLRQASYSQNSQNRKGALGITYVKKSKKWQAQITKNGKSIYLGTFKEKGDALKVRREAELKYFKEFAK